MSFKQQAQRCVFAAATLALAPLAAMAQEAGAEEIPETMAERFNALPWGRIFEAFLGGLFVVMLVLGILALATGLLNRWDARWDAPAGDAGGPPPSGGSSTTAASAPAQANSAEAGNVHVVIAAAVAAALKGRAYRVRRVRLAESPSTSWSTIGRVDIHSSHRIQKRN